MLKPKLPIQFFCQPFYWINLGSVTSNRLGFFESVNFLNPISFWEKSDNFLAEIWLFSKSRFLIRTFINFLPKNLLDI